MYNAFIVACSQLCQVCFIELLKEFDKIKLFKNNVHIHLNTITMEKKFTRTNEMSPLMLKHKRHSGFF